MLARNPVTLEQVSRLQELHERLDATVQHYLNTGVAVCQYHMDLSSPDWKERAKVWRKSTTLDAPACMSTFMQQIARDIKRPIILVKDQSSGGGYFVTATVRRTKAMYSVVLPTLLGSEELSWWGEKEIPVSHRVRPTRWELAFRGDEGRKALAAFIECCRTMHRSALKLDQPIP